jgi:AcrR family transcriptional regulator
MIPKKLNRGNTVRSGLEKEFKLRTKSDEKRQAIMAAATETFRELGFDGTSMSEIASRWGGSKATLYAHFGSKELLFMEVIIAAAEEQGEGLFDEIKNCDNLRVGLEDLGLRYLQLIMSPGPTAIYRLAVAQGGRSDLGQHFFGRGPGRFIAEMTGVMALFIEEGNLRKENPEVMALQLKALYEAEAGERRLLGMPTSNAKANLKAAVQRAVDVFLRAYGD